jgi:hypothetical protein
MMEPNDIVARLRSGEDGLEYAAADEIVRLRRGWLRVIQTENSCPATGGGCLAKRCGCLAEMEMLADEAAPDLAAAPEVKP